jgi:SAM-dependent methyltransferase
MSAMNWKKEVYNKLEHYLRRMEGPELEPYIWHSHYLTAKYSRRSMNMLGEQLKGKVLDIGAGTGHGARYLNKEKCIYFPIDLLTARDFSDKAITQKPEKIKVYCSCYELPFVENSMEGIMFISVLEHLEDPQLALKEAYRILAPGGNILVSTPFSFPVHGYPMDFRRWTLEGLKLEVENVGFKVTYGNAIGNTIASMALNMNLFLKYYIVSGRSKIAVLLVKLVTPFRLLTQLVFNLLAITLGWIDKSKSCPLGIAVLGTKENR